MNETSTDRFRLSNSFGHHMQCSLHLDRASMYVFVADSDIYVCIFSSFLEEKKFFFAIISTFLFAWLVMCVEYILCNDYTSVVGPVWLLKS